MINTRIIEIDPRELKLLKMNARFMSSGRMDTIESLQLPMRWLRNSGLCAQLLSNLSAIKYIVDSTKIFVKYPVLT